MAVRFISREAVPIECSIHATTFVPLGLACAASMNIVHRARLIEPAAWRRDSEQGRKISSGACDPIACSCLESESEDASGTFSSAMDSPRERSTFVDLHSISSKPRGINHPIPGGRARARADVDLYGATTRRSATSQQKAN